MTCRLSLKPSKIDQSINHQATICDFIWPIKRWNIDNLKGTVLPILIKLNHYPFPSQILWINLFGNLLTMENILTRQQLGLTTILLNPIQNLSFVVVFGNLILPYSPKSLLLTLL